MVFSISQGMLAFCCLFYSSSLALEMPKWTDIFSSLQPYQDPSIVEEGDPRIGFVQVSISGLVKERKQPQKKMLNLTNFQLNSGTTTFNATLNLTGHILLGLGIASSLLLYMFFNAFDSAGNEGDYGYFASKNKASLSQICSFHVLYITLLLI